MSDIIPFPQSKNKLIRDIKRAYQQEDYETDILEKREVRRNKEKEEQCVIALLT